MNQLSTQNTTMADSNMSGRKIKKALRKMPFPTSINKALKKIGKLLLCKSPMQKRNLALNLMAEFVFGEVDCQGNKRPPYTYSDELSVAAALLEHLIEMNDDLSRNIVFLALFNETTVIPRLGILSKLISLAMSLNSHNILISGRVWLQQLGTKSIYSCKLVELLTEEYFTLSLEYTFELSFSPMKSPQFAVNFITAIGELYYTKKCNAIFFPPIFLIQTILNWITENSNLCIASQLKGMALPPDVVAKDAYTPFAGLLKWCILAPIYGRNNDLYRDLHLKLISLIEEIPIRFRSKAIHTDHLAIPRGCIFSYTVEIKKKAKNDKTNIDSLIENDKYLQLSLLRFAQSVEVALSMNCLYGNIDQLMCQLSQLPKNVLMADVINKYHN